MKNNSKKIRILIVDDEPLGREAVRHLLNNDDEVEIVAESPDGIQALEDMQTYSPDVVFLDIQMPGCDGFEVLKRLPKHFSPLIIFVTAYDKYAIDAFTVHAIDYILKPIDPGRFRTALAAAKENLRSKERQAVNEHLYKFVESLQSTSGFADRIVVKTNGKMVFVSVEDVDWIESAGDYVCIHARGEKHIIRETMNSIEGKLNPGRFMRIHRSTIVSVDRVKEMEPLFQGQYLLRLRDGTKLVASRSYKKHIDTLLSKSI